MPTQLLIPENHLFLTAENAMRQICENVLSPAGIVYFNYLRYYNDGTSYLLCTHHGLVEYIFENDIPVAAPVSEKYIKAHFNYFVLPIDKYDKLVHYAKIHLKLEYFIDLIDRYDNYFELFCFGSTANNSEIVNFYLNNMNFLERFKLYFKDKADDLIKSGEQNKILLPEAMKPPYQGLGCDSNQSNKKYIESNFGNIKLTQRQYDCLAQLSIGRTAKETAKYLGLSHRTVENYLAHLKTVFDCSKRSQLIHVFQKNFVN